MKCFGQFLGLEEIRFSVIFMHAVLFRLINCKDTNKELWFKINGVEVHFSLVKFAFVIGLIFRDDTKVSHYVDYTRRLRLK